ncbi:hypothetical protein KY313_01850 [Candidatus Woesearchaeota archaeon]|jgi:hypothetical protein|nr:hypothetical protein [Candidatus Woesearchaeota archaeon]
MTDSRNEYYKKGYLQNKEEVIEYNKQYYQEHRDRIRSQQRDYWQREKDVINTQRSVRRERTRLDRWIEREKFIKELERVQS